VTKWRMVMHPSGRGFDPALECDRVCQFKRVGSDEVQTFRLADASPYFNVAGLMWREAPAERPQKDWASAAAYRPH
jgi:hypothetical protein